MRLLRILQFNDDTHFLIFDLDTDIAVTVSGLRIGLDIPPIHICEESKQDTMIKILFIAFLVFESRILIVFFR